LYAAAFHTTSASLMSSATATTSRAFRLLTHVPGEAAFGIGLLFFRWSVGDRLDAVPVSPEQIPRRGTQSKLSGAKPASGYPSKETCGRVAVEQRDEQFRGR